MIGPDGTARERLWAVGPWTSESPIAAFARPHTNAPCHRRNDALARESLETALSGNAPRPEAEEPEGGRPTAASRCSPLSPSAPRTPRGSACSARARSARP
ncbi:hypothetical protein [Brachybacterium sp. GPGPB12]|uniref:hypothetical protein n=1 Tax=Brachybacterium sp. GPGPB12 TaxID=3023517 RepID=UPI0031342B6B